MNIEHLKLFVRITSTQNISLAGKELGLSAAVASSHINKLEESLGVRLIHRTTRKVSITEEGRAFLPYAEDVIAGVEAARASVGAGTISPSGTLRVTAPVSFGRLHLVPLLNGFLSRYPNVKLELRLSDTIVDMVDGGFDIAIRNAELKDSSLIARKLAPDTRIVCASPEYLEQFGEPKTPEELQSHQCLNLIGLDRWVFNMSDRQVSINPKGHFRTDHGETVRDACAAGLGITINSRWCAYQLITEGKLIPILNDYPLVSKTAIWALYPSSRLIAPKVKGFIDYLQERFGKTPYWE